MGIRPFPGLDAPGRFDEAEKNVKVWKRDYVISAMIEATFFENAWYLRGFGEFLIDMISGPHMANALLDKLLKYKIKMVGHFMGLGVDVIRLGDDVGWQKGMLISPDLWRRYLKPKMRVLIAHIRKHSEAYMSWLLIFSGSP